jgi:Zn-dependent protease/regulator of sirC expression with transglutaminase-like and TPR domain
MSWSLVIGRLWGTEIRLHTSLLLLIPYVLFIAHPTDLPSALRVLLLLAAIFACVLLHELGHTLAARMLGIEVKSVVLWPLGGVANLSRRPERVLHNLMITAAGPFTNLLLSCILVTVLVGGRLLGSFGFSLPQAAWLAQLNLFPLLMGLLFANLSLAVFNMVPIFPLDGGQIARDLLKLAFGEKNADLLMLFISLPLAIGMTILGIVLVDLVIILTGLMLILASLSLNPKITNLINQGLLYIFDRSGYFLRQGDYDRSITIISRDLRRRPHQSGLYLSRALAYQNLLAPHTAWQDVNHALQLDPRNFMAWTLKGELSESYRRDAALAMTCYTQAIELNPSWPLAYADRAGLYHREGNLELAMKDYDQAVAHYQGMIVVFLLRSILRYELGDLPGAYADSEQALRFAPAWLVSFQEAFLSTLQGHLEWALDYYQRAQQRMPGAYQVYQGRADALRVNGRAQEALADYDQAIRLEPKQAELYLRRGKAYRDLGQHARASADFQQAARLAAFSHTRRHAQAELQMLSINDGMPDEARQTAAGS